MGRRGWAILISSVLVCILIAILIVKSDQWTNNDSFQENHWSEQVVKGNEKYKIVQLFVNGEIDEESSIRNSFNSKDFLSELDQTIVDKNVKGVVIRINSPGGSVVSSDDIHNKILEVRKAGKPVVVSMGNVAASGGYYISTAADQIFANKATLTGSLGVIFETSNYKKLSEMIGYKENVIKSGEFKDIGNPLREMTSNERNIFQALVDEAYQQFVDVIVNGRHMTKAQVLKIADGRVYSGKQAKSLGLIDQFGSLDDATNYLIKTKGFSNPKVVNYEQKFSFSSVFSGISQSIGFSPNEIFKQILHEETKQPELEYLFNP